MKAAYLKQKKIECSYVSLCDCWSSKHFYKARLAFFMAEDTNKDITLVTLKTMNAAMRNLDNEIKQAKKKKFLPLTSAKHNVG